MHRFPPVLGLRCGILGLLALVCLACAAEPVAEQAVKTVPGSPSPDFAVAFRRLVADGEGFDLLRIEAECAQDDVLRSAAVFGSGFGIWDSREQVVIARDQIRALLEEFGRVDFPAMQDFYGRESETQGIAKQGQGRPRVVCRVSLGLPGHRKEVVQMASGGQSQELRTLALRVLDVARLAGGERVGAESLQDGLRKIAEGVLVPQALRVVVNRLQLAGVETDKPGFILQLDGHNVEIRDMTVAGGYVDPVYAIISDEEVTAIARVLAANNAGTLPINLWSDQYVDLHLEVLSHKLAIQGDRFARLQTSHPEARAAVETIVSDLYELRRRLLERATGTAPR